MRGAESTPGTLRNQRGERQIRTPVELLSVVDDDTIRTTAGRLRIIGIDTPESGECGHAEASMLIGRLVSRGDEVVLELPPGQNDVDKYERLIRYVTTADGVDIGMAQLEAGNAVARYDSRDGYPQIQARFPLGNRA